MTDLETDHLTLKLSYGEASALCYFIAFAALHHTQGDRKLTPHEDSMVTKVSQMDSSSYEMWRESVMKAAKEDSA